MRTQLISLFALIAHVDLRFIGRQLIDQRFVTGRPHFHQLTVQVQYLGTSRLFVQIINILRNYLNVKILLHICNSGMPLIGLCTDQLAPADIIKLQHKCRISVECFGSGNIFNGVFIP
ncbi:hypothetical protein SDC9_167197 [bioreactor metagenome]|uniref:Uncharacterized protein n=1 Tax=bioreactor metagenome TaxID=1076179 RepID=A0A645FZK5_9ZZZZ